MPKRRDQRPTRAFTLIELLVAAVISAFVLGSVATSLGQLGKAKSIGKERLDAHLRADAALTMLRRDLASVVRTDDLFFTRLVIFDAVVNTPQGDADRDELLLFANRIRPIRDINYRGEGSEYETHYRIEVDEAGPVLWQRRDALPDEYPFGGGVANPEVEGLLSVNYEAYDGIEWFEEWDSDDHGLPLAVRITVVASGHRPYRDPYDAPLAVLRTTVAIDRVPIPLDHFQEEEIIPESDEDALLPDDTGALGDDPTGGGGEAGGGGGADPGLGDQGGGGRDTVPDTTDADDRDVEAPPE